METVFDVIDGIWEELDSAPTAHATPVVTGVVVRKAAEFVVQDREAVISYLSRLFPDDEKIKGAIADLQRGVHRIAGV